MRLPVGKFRPLLLAALATILNLGLLLLPLLLLRDPGLPLVEWRSALFLAHVAAWGLLEHVVSPERPHAPHSPPATRRPAALLSAATLFVFLSSMAELALRAPAHLTVWAAIGWLALAGGIALRLWAIRTLGRYFLDEATILQGQPLFTEGLYAHLRHPSETGNLCIGFGAALLLGSFAGVAVCVIVLLPIVLFRVWTEDNLLDDHYPQRFAAYRQDVPALFPRLPGLWNR